MILRYQPAPRQLAFHEAGQERRWYCAGYGSGKTTAAVLEAFSLAALRHPGYTGIVAAPTFQLLDQGWFAEWRRWIDRAWWSIRGSPRQGAEIAVRCPGGETSTVLLRSTSNPWANEAVNAAWLVFDEATRERRREAYSVLLGRVRRGYPGRQRSVILTGPPMTRRHWTAAEFGAGPDSGHGGTYQQWQDEHHCVVRARTADNPYLPPGYEDALRARPGASRAWCAQFLDAEFGAMEGAVYEAWSRDVHVVRAATLANRTWRDIVAGTDWGWEHPGVMLVVAADGLGDLYVLHEEVHQHRVVADVPDGWVPIARRLVQAHHVRRFPADPSRPGDALVVHRAVRGLGARCYEADNDVSEGIRRVAARLEGAVDRARPAAPGARQRRRPALYVSETCEATIASLESYAHRRDRWGEVTDEPEKRHDDPADALRYAVMDLTRE